MLACAHCDGALKLPAPHDAKLDCAQCGTQFTRTDRGVWDFRGHNDGPRPLSIFEEPEFRRWVEIFGTLEIRDWKIYDSPFKRFFSQAGHRKVARELRRRMMADDWVIEVGAAGGELLNHIDCQNYIGIDTNLNALENMAQNIPGKILVCTSGGRLPLIANSVKYLVALHTLEHIYLLGEFLEDVGRVLMLGGRFMYAIPCEGGLPFALGRVLVTGPHLRKKYGLDVNYVMSREHINDANRVLKFVRMYFPRSRWNYWPIRFLHFHNANAMIWGECKKIH